MDVADFLKEINAEFSISSLGINWDAKLTYFRGQSYDGWGITPSLFRYNVYLEHKILSYAQKVLWKELHYCDTYIEKLIILQHFGFPTRLLDVTTNPLVALYFACEENDKNGVVYCGNNDVTESSVVEEILSIPFQKEIPSIINNLREIGLDDTKLQVVTETQYISPLLNNERIIAQNGAFLIPPLIEEVQNIFYLNNQNLPLSNVFHKTITIPSKDKLGIRNELMTYGIHEGMLFPDIEHKLQYVKRLVESQQMQIAN